MPKDHNPSALGASKPKPERNEAIVTMLEADPDITFQQVGDLFDLTRQRVQQIWFRYTSTTRQKPPATTRLCRICGETYPGSRGAGYAEHVATAEHGPNESQYKRNNEWEALYKDGISTTQIARIYNVHVSQVWTVLSKQRHIKLQPKGRKGGTIVRIKHG